MLVVPNVCCVAQCCATHCCRFNISRADKLYEQIHLYIEGMGGFVWQEYVMGMSLLT
jgi:hypothetical protein